MGALALYVWACEGRHDPLGYYRTAASDRFTYWSGHGY